MSEPTKQETARHMKALWAALAAPNWPKDDLIDLGKLIYAKVPLAEIDEKVFARLFPKLTEVSNALVAALQASAPQPAPDASQAATLPPKTEPST